MPKLMDAKTGMFVKTLKLMAAYISGFTVVGIGRYISQFKRS